MASGVLVPTCEVSVSPSNVVSGHFQFVIELSCSPAFVLSDCYKSQWPAIAQPTTGKAPNIDMELLEQKKDSMCATRARTFDLPEPAQPWLFTASFAWVDHYGW